MAKSFTYRERMNIIRAGLAAEALVKAELLLNGFAVHSSDPFSGHDLIAESPTGKLYKIQVKGQAKPRRGKPKNSTPMYAWHLTHSGGKYDKETVDVVALVAIDIRQIAFIKHKDLPQLQTIHLYAPGVTPKSHRATSINRDMSTHTLQKAIKNKGDK